METQPGTALKAALSLVLLAAAVAPTRYAQMTETQLNAALAKAQSIPELGARMQAVSEPFLGTPYVLGNLGEGPDGDGRDQDPRFNVQGVDCTTFVEHVLAFTLSGSAADARQRLDAIRYVHGQVNYGTRRHWPEAQWVPGLVAEGYLEDVTARVAGPDIPLGRAEVDLDAERFSKSSHAASMPLTPAEVPVGHFSLPYVPLDQTLRAAPRLKAGMIINVVKEPKDGLLVRISHQGLVVRKGQDVFIRHASSVGPKAVMDEPLQDFLERQRKSRAWPTVGFHFLALRPDAQRSSSSAGSTTSR